MSFDEKATWVYALTSAVAGALYFVVVLGQAQTTPVGDVEYIVPMIVAIAAAVLGSIVGIVLISIAAPSEADKRDERDKQVNRFGDQVGLHTMSLLAIVPLGLAMGEFEHFWIANALYAAFVLTALVSSAFKLVAYRRGL